MNQWDASHNHCSAPEDEAAGIEDDDDDDDDDAGALEELAPSSVAVKRAVSAPMSLPPPPPPAVPYVKPKQPNQYTVRTTEKQRAHLSVPCCKACVHSPQYLVFFSKYAYLLSCPFQRYM
jgi:hypothetical protein